ncbi:MAG: nucleotidyltransferase family protein, partial [Lachnospiraceae bacterium]|nr:nucleotidyltransferase family protein [Lachnospiraceae bacterium]
IVFELPVAAATGSAELFAEGAVKLLSSLGIIDTLVFGSECGDIEALQSIARKMLDESDEYRALLKQGLKEGLAFPRARKLALKEDSGIADSPNNILGIEYCKAVMRLETLQASGLPEHGYRIPKLLTLRRVGHDYHDETIPADKSPGADISDLDAASLPEHKEPCPVSAAAVRKMMLDGFKGEAEAKDLNLESVTPGSAASILEREYGVSLPMEEDDLSDMLAVRLWTLAEEEGDLADIMDMTQGLERKLLNLPKGPVKFSQLAMELKTKDITYTAICRALLHVALGTKKSFVGQIKEAAVFPYARLLGFRSSGSQVLRQISDSASLRLITKLADADRDNGLLAHDIFAAQCYNQTVYSKFGTKLRGEYETGPVILQ